jgi:nucleoside-diphosphate-sugar epimerase
VKPRDPAGNPVAGWAHHDQVRIAVTGSAGKVGRAVVARARAEGHAVVEVDRPVDVTDHDALLRAVEGCDAIVHLAAYANPTGRPGHVTHNNNVTASYNALSVAVALGIDRVCLASSINATGAVFSRRARYDYLPVDEAHPTYNEDAYSLSKWIAETQADSVARRHESMTIASLRLHGVNPYRPVLTEERAHDFESSTRELWGWVRDTAVARACLLALAAPYRGHEVFYVVAPDTVVDTPTAELCRRFYPGVPVRTDLRGNQGLFDCGKAERLLGWRHDDEDNSTQPGAA